MLCLVTGLAHTRLHSSQKLLIAAGYTETRAVGSMLGAGGRAKSILDTEGSMGL